MLTIYQAKVLNFIHTDDYVIRLTPGRFFLLPPTIMSVFTELQESISKTQLGVTSLLHSLSQSSLSYCQTESALFLHSVRITEVGWVSVRAIEVRHRFVYHLKQLARSWCDFVALFKTGVAQLPIRN